MQPKQRESNGNYISVSYTAIKNAVIGIGRFFSGYEKKERIRKLEEMLDSTERERDGLKDQNAYLKRDAETLAGRVHEMGREHERNVGFAISGAKYWGVAHLNSHNEVIYANEAMENCLGKTYLEIRGKELSSLPKNLDFRAYMAVFEGMGEDLLHGDSDFDSHEVTINKKPFGVTVFPLISGEGPNRTYEGAEVLIVPLQTPVKTISKTKEVISWIWGENQYVEVSGVITWKNMLDLLRPVMYSGNLPVVVDMRDTEKIQDLAVNALAKCLAKLDEIGKSYRLKFVPEDVAAQLKKRGVRKIRFYKRPEPVLCIEEQINGYLRMQQKKPVPETPQENKKPNLGKSAPETI